MCWNCPDNRSCGGPWAIGFVCLSLLVIGTFSIVGCCVDDDHHKPQQQIRIAPPQPPAQTQTKALDNSEALESKYQRSNDPQPVDLHAKVIWRLVTVFDRDTATVLESHLTSEPVDVENKHLQGYGGKDLTPYDHMVNGNTIIKIIPPDVAEKIKNDKQAIREEAKKAVVNLGLPTN